MARQNVTGIGGIFFKAADPAMLSNWYETHLGVLPSPVSTGDPVWQQQAGPTVFEPMDAGSGFFNDRAQLSINFRVPDLDAMCQQLREAGIAVDVDPTTYPYGRFASLEDPEGNQVQLWEVA